MTAELKELARRLTESSAHQKQTNLVRPEDVTIAAQWMLAVMPENLMPLLDEIDRLRADLLEAVEALKFYASASWSQLDDDLIQIGSFMHPGRRARAVLSRLEERS